MKSVKSSRLRLSALRPGRTELQVVFQGFNLGWVTRRIRKKAQVLQKRLQCSLGGQSKEFED